MVHWKLHCFFKFDQYKSLLKIFKYVISASDDNFTNSFKLFLENHFNENYKNNYKNNKNKLVIFTSVFCIDLITKLTWYLLGIPLPTFSRW